MKKTILMLGAALALTATTAFAHPDHDEVQEQVLKLELGKKKDGAIVYVTSDGHKVSTIGASGTLSYSVGGKATEIALTPSGVNGMEPVKATTIAAGTKARATVTTAEKVTVSSDFLVK